MTADIIPLRFRKPRRSRGATLGHLIDFAYGIPVDQIMPKLQVHFHAIEKLASRGDNNRELMRELFLAGALITRYLFQVTAMPRNRSHRI